MLKLSMIWSEGVRLMFGGCSPDTPPRCAAIDFHQVWGPSTYPFPSYNVFYCLAATMTCERLTLNVCNVWDAMWSNFVPNFSEIGQSAAELLRFQYVQVGRRPPSWIRPEMYFHSSAVSAFRIHEGVGQFWPNFHVEGDVPHKRFLQG